MANFMTKTWLWRWTKRLSLFVLIAFLCIVAVRFYDAQRKAPLSVWHTWVPEEMHEHEIDQATWADYIAHENRLFDAVKKNVTDKLPEDERVPANRYFSGSPIYPGRFRTDWNRSYTLMPEGAPRGVAVMLHGLTDSPYSLRHIAQRYQRDGFAVVAVRLPGHGTVPSGLTEVTAEDWEAATRLAVREARRLVPAPAPLHIVGFSNGGALALQYSLEAVQNPSLPRADHLILISPMIGITRFARFAGLAALPSILPSFAKAAWLDIVPEFNPFKYNSFPVNGARQSWRVTQRVQQELAQAGRSGQLAQLPPALTFQSVLDFTVSTSAIISSLYAQLPANGSELVLFDINRTAQWSPLLRASMRDALRRIAPAPPLRYRLTLLTNASATSPQVIEQSTAANETTAAVKPTGLDYPPDVYSLSHVALPFPVTDSLYGRTPDPDDDLGIHLGAQSVRGETGALIVGAGLLTRLSWNPFYPYIVERIDYLAHASP
ncbi:alpha-beta hydrolase superfamily lysophospholipase [Paraburkholderia unamae]|uniref:Alpha-beta hydrolase superfamily lysophospholipase n=2 Tax=Paraburkholderia unamae TaxID=219649 RepID=A0ABX5KEZ2_9BURK|nr:alpha-beta hydrolase superfamily lysophospholipase [Paraburkholderia unamae]CAG9257051.1 Lysophospholipase, alpha-beta hydrolase superfamily [Paraburkholderia unamae]